MTIMCIYIYIVFFFIELNVIVVLKVREDKTVIVADFGLARIVSHNTDSVGRRMSPKGTPGSRKQERKKRYTVVGNPYWMAPEMMKGNKYDEKVDIFSFGIILCEVSGDFCKKKLCP